MSLTTGEPFEIPSAHRNGCCRPVTEFEKLNRVGEGTYGIVYRARDTKSNEVRGYGLNLRNSVPSEGHQVE